MHDIHGMKKQEKKLLERFLRYTRIDTASSSGSETTPSTERQWDLLRLLEKELEEIGIKEKCLDKNGYLHAYIPPSPGCEDIPVIGFLAHVDTSSDVPASGVKPVVHENYDGGTIILGETVLDPQEFPDLLRYRGETIITSDGSTLLGADDKGGVAVIMTAAEVLSGDSRIRHGGVEIFFTPDEEIGRGMSKFPFEKVKSVFCYTFDGDGEGTIESECFNACSAKVEIKGKVIHLGSARGKLVNAVKVASDFISLLPSSESPEATDGRYGYYCPHSVTGTIEKASAEILLRDFDRKRMEERLEAVDAAAKAVEAMHRGCSVSVTVTRQYSNMIDFIGKESRGMSLLRKAVEKSGARPSEKIIRGGTDGARLSEAGIPCPNIFAGGHNFHSKKEWAVLSSMLRASSVMVFLAELWAE